jgi:hypothetical protein
MGSRTGTKVWPEVAMSTLYYAITGGSVYATVRSLILADPSTILFGKSADAGKGLKQGAKFEIDPSGEIDFSGVPENMHKVDFTTVGYDTISDAAARAALWAKKGVKQYFYFFDEDTQDIRLVGKMMPMIKCTYENGKVEEFNITASDQASSTNVYLEKQYGTGTDTPYIQILTPNTAIDADQGSTVTITWRANFTDAVKIELYKGAVLDSTINAGIGAMAATYAWVVPADQTPGTDYSIKITRISGTAATDESDVDFTISVP